MKAKKPAKPKPPVAEPVNDSAGVDELLARTEHPLKAEIEAVRAIIKRADPRIGERVKWNAPSFFHRQDLAAFNLHQKGFVQLVFIYHHGAMSRDTSGLLEGDYKDRRLAKFQDLADVRAKQAALTRVVREWVALLDGATKS